MTERAAGDGRWVWTINDGAFPDVDMLDIEAGSLATIHDRPHQRVTAPAPMHLHGQVFEVINRNGQLIDEGHFRETVLLYPGDQIDIGVALDTGTRAFHCHVREHAEAGMMSFVDVTERS